MTPLLLVRDLRGYTDASLRTLERTLSLEASHYPTELEQTERELAVVREVMKERGILPTTL